MLKLEQLESMDNLVSLVKTLQMIIGNDDMAITVTDKEKLIAYIPGRTIKLPVNIGMKLNPRWGVAQAMQKREVIRQIMPKEVLGIVYRAICTPVQDNDGKVVGCVGISMSIDRQHQLMEMADILSESLSEIGKGVEDIAANAQDLAKSNIDVTNSAVKTKQEIMNTQKVLDIIKGISQRSNMLGINAAIESAKAGEYGRGFSVVADEIRKMSSGSHEAVKDVQSILLTSMHNVEKIVQEIEHNSLGIQHQAAAVEQINASIEELTAMSSTLASLSKQL